MFHAEDPFAAAFPLALLVGFGAGASSRSAAAAQAPKARTDLHWDVLTVKRPGRDLPPGANERLASLAWIANSSTLIYGERDAVLVDTFLTAEQSKTLVDWVVASGKNLTTIYVTHGHPDHFFGLAQLLDRFPRARAVATPEVVQAVQAYLASGRVETLRQALLPAHVPDRLLVPQALEGSELDLEGHKLVVVNDGRTDTAHSTSLLVPSIALLVAGDAVYNGIHPYLGETDNQSRLEWISSLAKLESLKPRTVIAGHKVPGNDDAPSSIGETRKYLQDFNRLAEATTSPRELYDAMLKLYPNRVNPGSIWNAANTVKKVPPT
jgi:glyoxylase-like metal-dependent hydrolase (beta-lactamase superfamily II)